MDHEHYVYKGPGPNWSPSWDTGGQDYSKEISRSELGFHFAVWHFAHVYGCTYLAQVATDHLLAALFGNPDPRHILELHHHPFDFDPGLLERALDRRQVRPLKTYWTMEDVDEWQVLAAENTLKTQSDLVLNMREIEKVPIDMLGFWCCR